MQKRSVRLSRLAQEDLEGILRWYSSQAGIAVAHRFANAFDLLVDGLTSGSIQGRKREFQIPELREVRSAGFPRPFRVYLAFFTKVGEEEIFVLRILHGNRDLPRLLK